MAEKKVKAEPVHLDRFDRRINVGDCVAVAHQNGLIVANVIKLNAKMIKIRKLGVGASRWNEHNKYSADMVVVSGPEVTMYLLKHGS
jgi:hypothetical protein